MNKLWVRLTAAIMAVALVAVVLFAVVTSRTLEVRFRGYVGRQTSENARGIVVNALEAYYARQGSWAGLDNNTSLLETAEEETQGQGRGFGQGQAQGQLMGRGGMGMGQGATMSGVSYTLFDADGNYIFGSDTARGTDNATADELAQATSLEANGETVGWLFLRSSGQVLLDAAQAEFLQQIRRTMLVMVALATALALLVGVAVSQFVTRPLDKLTGAAQIVAAGGLGEQVEIPVGQADEITTLATSFNRMSGALAEAEVQRQRLTADIAHELRTPLSVMRVQLQAMLDGVHPTDTAHVAIVYEQTLHLARLVDDLHTLTRAETGHLPLEMQPLDPAGLVNRAATLFKPLAQDTDITLDVLISPSLPRINADGDRVQQVLANLLANALRHTPPGGTIRLSAARDAQKVRFAVSNTGSTLTPEQASHVFERFWRTDESRQRDSGGAGLGLAIVRELVHLHGGRIWVDVEGDETRFIFELPALPA